jgi:hypothetical protein
MVIFITGKQNGSYHRKLPASLLVLALILIEVQVTVNLRLLYKVKLFYPHLCLTQWEEQKINRFLHESLLKIWDFFHECEINILKGNID